LIVRLKFNNLDAILIVRSLVIFVVDLAGMVMVLDGSFVVIMALVIVPMLVADSACLENSFQNQEEYD
jgi:hypothetical protein